MALSYAKMSMHCEISQRVADLIPWRTWGREHLFTSKDSVGTCHEAHSLLCFRKSIPSSGETNDGSWKNYTGRRNRTDKSMMRYPLSCDVKLAKSIGKDVQLPRCFRVEFQEWERVHLLGKTPDVPAYFMPLSE